MTPIRVLIVDDNTGYREAFRRNLILEGFEVAEAGDSTDALEKLHDFEADAVVTDLAMRHATEGLDLIRRVRALRPSLPVIMISAVGTFDEGAEAMRLGAWQVISKSRIDEEMGGLLKAIEAASKHHAAARALQARLKELGAMAATDRAAAIAGLNEILRSGEAAPEIKGEAFELLQEINRDGATPGAAETGAANLPQPAAEGAIDEVDRALATDLPSYETMENDTRQSLRTAEFLFRTGGPAEVDFSRSMGFAYCFAVENEVKSRLRKRLQRFFADPETPRLINSLMERNGRSLSIFYQQYLLRLLQGRESEATIENYFHTFQRIQEHGGRYKPDGLKALGIILVCFGRGYSFKMMNKDFPIENPLGIKGLDGSDEVLAFAGLLINLQHYRNPYIHPELSEMTKLSQIRETAFACLRMIAKLQ